MPRFIANMVTQIRRGYPYQTYTYTSRGYKYLLSRAGFKEIDFFYPYGGYNDARQMVPLNSKMLDTYFLLVNKSSSQLKRLVKRGLAITGAFNWLAPSFLIFSRKKGAEQTTSLTRLIKRAICKVGHANFSNKFFLIVNNTSETHITFLVFIGLYRNPSLVVTHSLRKGFNKIFEKEYINIQRIRHLLPDNMKQSIPIPISLDYSEKRAVCIKSFIKGRKLGNKLSKREILSITDHVAEWLLEFHKIFAEKKVLFEKKRLNDLLYSPLKQFSTKNKFDIPINFYAWIEKKVEKFENHSVQMSPQHGDFWYGNTVLSNNRLGIYDWEFFGEVNLPLFDLFHFLTILLTSPDILYKDREKNFDILFSHNELSKIMKKTVYEVAKKIEIDDEMVDFLYFLYLINFYNKISLKFLCQENIDYIKHFIMRFIIMTDSFILNKG